ncbi:unnamed protein product [Didymodactylos carnosus]|uniref:Reverse transcriptase/retrotransposon-derived protein RNase H-like domain-containing protein n=1 Tax=Didymodactylos carnosus TaxID=1234261 RepID=A0A814XPB6_9BILA|nr:unnamed protein product [Didymodactylos carnosus]CAF3981615.1 unnamed protein product [Didymodactylos carnosus]
MFPRPRRTYCNLELIVLLLNVSGVTVKIVSRRSAKYGGSHIIAGVIHVQGYDDEHLFNPVSAAIDSKGNMSLHWSKWNSTVKGEGEEQQQALDHIKQILTTEPVLHFPGDTLPYKLYTDVSEVGIGGVLNDVVDQGEKPVMYLSRSINKAEKHYATTEKECLAIVWCIKRLRNYLYDRDFTVVIDHYPLS